MFYLRLTWRGALAGAVLGLAACDGDGASYDTSDAAIGSDLDAAPGHDAGPPPDTDGAVAMDASVADASADAASADANVADADTGDAGDGPHPLAGHYAVRTVLYARQKASVLDTPLDLVSKGVLLSVADIDEQGTVTEHYCLLEIVNDGGIYSWTLPDAAEAIDDSVVALTREGELFVRGLEADRSYVSWSPELEPADCVPGEQHATGCLCAEDDELPSQPDDCRVTDLEGDEKPGAALFVGTERPLDPASAAAPVTLHIALTKAVEWRLPASAGDALVGALRGGIAQRELSREGELADVFGPIRNAICPDEYSHVELVRGTLDCAAIMAGRAGDLDGHGIFDVSLDGVAPAVEVCPDPDCALDTDGDGHADCDDRCPNDELKQDPGLCGCGEADTDADSDGTPACHDECDGDPNKTSAGSCGCGVAETDGDGDLTPDCSDGCATDPAKTAPGQCGCGTADTNADGDAQADCNETCDADPNKLAPGICGCGTADTNSDGDAQADCNETCDADPSKLAPGICGCGTPDTNTDGDAQADCNETCDADPSKLAPGICGCGTPDTNTDGDAQADCNETCDADPNKLAPGLCGCGTPDTNSDGDSQPNCNETCDNDPNKLAPGLCGCGTPDTNSDGDSQPDCRETCDNDPNKLAPGVCGCGTADADLNGDGTIDCSDECPNDPAKVAPGVCGCGVPDTNRDGDSQADCNETCDLDPGKLAPGQCGCGVADTDSDADGVANCNDACPDDPDKATLGLCGCGVADTNTDGDSQPDCTDACDTDATKTAPGLCGCGVPDTNSDGDSQPNCNETCDNDPGKLAPGLCGCGVADTNTDGDALPDCTDGCDSDPNKTVPGECGCGVPESACAPSPLLGTYAVRSILYTKARSGTTTSGSKAINFSVITITDNGNGTLRLVDRGCYTETQPLSGNPLVYSWSKASWVQAMPAVERTLTENADGTWTRAGVLTNVGFSPANQPTPCTATSTPLPGDWLTAWGTTCRCTNPADSLPPFNKTTPYDCRVIDLDRDGYPGVSAFASTSPAASPEADADGLSGARLMITSRAFNTWTITPANDGRHTGTVTDSSQPAVVGCVRAGLVSACSQVTANPVNTICPQQFNKATFVPVASNYTCPTLVTNRATLFTGVNDGTLPNDTVCAPP